MDDFLANRYQRVALNVQVSKWAAVNVGVPQVSILPLLLFVIYINVLSNMNYHQILGLLQMTLFYFWLVRIRIYQLTF